MTRNVTERSRIQTEDFESLRTQMRGRVMTSNDPENIFRLNQNIQPAAV